MTHPAHPAAPTRPPALAAQAFWLAVAKTVGFCLSVALPLLLVRLFTQREYGVYRQAFVVIATTYALMSMGMSTSPFYFLSRKTEGRPQIVLNVVLFNAAAGMLPFLALALCPRLLVWIFGGSELLRYARLIGAVMLLTIFSSFLEFIATALQDVKRSTAFIIFAQLSKLVLMVAAALGWGSIEALLYAALVQGLLQSAILLWYLHQRFGRFWACFDWAFFREQVGYALSYGFYGLLMSAQGDLHNYFVAHAFGPAAFAIYSVGCMQIPLLGLLRDSIGTVMISRTAELESQGKPREILLLTARAMRKTALIYIPAFALLMVVGQDFLLLLYTRRYAASWPIFAVNLTMLLLLVPITDPIIRAYAKERFFFVRVRLVLLSVQVALLWYAVHHLGMLGAIGVVIVVAIAERAIFGWRTASLVGLRASDARLFGGILRIALASAGGAAAAFALRRALATAPPLGMLLGCGTVFAIVFGLLAMRLKVFEADEIEMARRQWARLRRRLAPARNVSRGDSI